MWHFCAMHTVSGNPGDVCIPVQNLEPVLRACPELQTLNLASCAMLGENALDALLPGCAWHLQSPGFRQVLLSPVIPPVLWISFL